MKRDGDENGGAQALHKRVYHARVVCMCLSVHACTVYECICDILE